MPFLDYGSTEGHLQMVRALAECTEDAKAARLEFARGFYIDWKIWQDLTCDSYNGRKSKAGSIEVAEFYKSRPYLRSVCTEQRYG